MYKGKRIVVVVPAHNESALISSVVGSMPSFVDEIIVVDDGSDDDTAGRARGATARCPVEILRHPRNQGVGAAIRTGYHRAIERAADVIVVMAGDGQMDPSDLEEVIAPVVRGEADYSKGNRLAAGVRPKGMPRLRYLGIVILTRLTMFASGYSELTDSQSGYTAISAECLREIPIHTLYHGYGYPNHLLVLLGAANCTLTDVPVRAIYGEGERSELSCLRLAPRLALLLSKWYLWRRVGRRSSADSRTFFYGLTRLSSVIFCAKWSETGN